MFYDNFFYTPIGFMVICELLVITSFSLKAEKETLKSISFKIITAVILIAAVNLLDYFFVDFETASTALEAPLCFTAAFLYAYIALKAPIKEAVYCTTWSYIITEMATQIVMPIKDVRINGMSEALHNAKTLLLFVGVIAIIFFLIRRYLREELMINGHYHVGRQKILLSTLAAVVYLMLSNYQFIFWLLGFEPENGLNMITIFRLVAGCAGLFCLYLQNSIEKKQGVERELEMIQQLWYYQQNQYRLSQENIDLINRKCHDLKYQMAALRKLSSENEINEQLRELENSVMIYDSVVKTGNPVLDTVLTEKSLYCEAHQINMTCMVDGSELDFIGAVDLYAIFGNALDNAIESVMKQTDKEKRVIQVAAFHEKDLLLIRVGNYCEAKIKFVNGLPVSTKSDSGYHGFGLKSIRSIAEKYGGGIVCQAIDHYFALQVLLPIPPKS